MDEQYEIDPALLARVARRFSRRPEFLGYWLDLYRDVEGMELPALARELGCRLETLNDLAVCLKPAPEALAQATERLSTRFGVDRKALIRVILQAEGYARARTAAPRQESASGFRAVSRGVFAAARDRDESVTGAPDGEPSPVQEPEDEDGC